MKKILAILLAAALLAAAAVCAAEEPADLFGRIQGLTFTFSSGAGAWSTELTVGEDGAFTGLYHDSEMGETGEDFPDGTVYGCLFHGRFSNPVPVDEYALTLEVSAEADEGQVPESVEDGVRYVTAVPYGMENASKVTLFLPGTPVSRLPEDFLFWTHIQESDPDAETIPFYAVWNEADGSGFISEIPQKAAEPAGTPVGGWTPAADPAVTDGVRALVEKGLDGLLGVNYVPVAYLGSQVVAGTNHAVLCQASVVYPGAQPGFVILYLYEDLQGNVTILNIADFDIGSLCTYGAENAD